MPKSLILHESLQFHGGGPRSFLFLARRLPSEQFHYGSLAEVSDGLESQLEEEGARVFSCRSDNRLVQIFRLWSYLRKNGIKAVFACSFRCYYLAKIVSLLLPLQVVFWIRDIAIMQTKSKRFVFKLLSRKDWLIASSLAGLYAHSKPGREQTALVYSGVEIPVVSDKAESRKVVGLPSEAVVLLYAADFKQYKDHATLFRAFKRLAPGWPQLHLALCGRRGTLQEDLVDPILGGTPAKDRVLMFGRRRDIDTFFSAADIYVHPCYVECFGNAVVEAMAAGLPVVAAAGGGLPEVVGDCGILFEPHNDQELSAAILRLLSSESQREVLAEKGRARALKNFTADAYASRFLKTANSILNHEFEQRA